MQKYKTLNTNMMKKIFHTFLVLATIVFMSFGSDDEGEISNEDMVKEKLEGTWSPSYVSLDDNEITSDFATLAVTLNSSLGFTTNSADLDRQPNPWPSSGTFTVDTNDDPSIFTLTRDDGLQILGVLDESGTTVQFDFTFTGDNSSSTGRMNTVEGSWTFVLTK